MKPAVRVKLEARDAHCWHCGTTEDLVPHHRANRGMGGSKNRDRLDNLILVCALYNGLMESDSGVASQARVDGHKLQSWQPYETTVVDRADGLMYWLDPLGGKHVTGVDLTPF